MVAGSKGREEERQGGREVENGKIGQELHLYIYIYTYIAYIYI
jgi:hypothetical protein